MLKVANIFSNDMVLQRDKNITVWGLGDEERTVTVTLNGVSVQTQVCDGRWTAVLPPMSAGGEYEMTVSDGCTEKKFCRIMIGEVWFCGGQSNMELELQNAKGGKEVLENLTPDCNVRFYYTQKRGTLDEMFYEDENNTAWSQASKDNSRAWSAVGFFFARKLAKDLGVTVGLIGCNWGGTSASAWVDRPTLENNAEIRSYIDEYEKRIEGKTVEEQIKEYRDYQKQKELFQNPEYQILIEKNPEFREIKAFFAAWEFETFIYVEHFAVNPVLRNGGVGSRMLKALTEDAEKMIILEVEPPTEEIAVRRVRFYERNGFFFNDYPYIQPSMGEGRKETPLFLMSTERKIDEEEYRMIRNTLYTKVYGKKDVLKRERFIDMC